MLPVKGQVRAEFRSIETTATRPTKMAGSLAFWRYFMPRHSSTDALFSVLNRLGTDALAQWNLLLGIAHMANDGVQDVWLWTDTTPEKSTLLAVQTPSRPITLGSVSTVSEEILTALCQDLHLAGRHISGVQAPPDLAQNFAGKWCAQTGCRCVLHRNILQFRQDDSDFRAVTTGFMDHFREEEFSVAATWEQAFSAEFDAPGSPFDFVRFAKMLKNTWCWRVDGQAVAMARTTRPVLDSLAIAGVYTPPEHRRHGYASDLVGTLSQHLRQSGVRLRLLNTDASNPTSNAIYRRLGYHQVGQMDLYHFFPKEP